MLPESRAPYGARGLKLLWLLNGGVSSESRPVWGAWIEIPLRMGPLLPAISRAPYGARGLKLLIGGAIGIFGRCRAPYGARGLKSTADPLLVSAAYVAPRMGRVD